MRKIVLVALLCSALAVPAFAQEEAWPEVDLSSPPAKAEPYDIRLVYCASAAEMVVGPSAQMVPETDEDAERLGNNGPFRIEVDLCLLDPLFYAKEHGFVAE